MRLAKLTGLEIEKLEAELKEVRAIIKELRDAARLAREADGAPQERAAGDRRRSTATSAASEITSDEGEFTIEDLIADEEMVVTISHSGYIKRTSVSHVQEAAARRPRAQRAGAQGRGLHRAPLHRQHARVPPRLHRRRALLLAQGARDPAGGPRGQGQAGRQPDQRHAGHEGPGDRAGARVPRRPVPPLRHQEGHGEEDGALARTPTRARTGSRRSRSRRATS